VEKNSPWMQNQKEQWSGLVNRLKKQDKMLKKTHCQSAVSGTNLIATYVQSRGK